MKVFELLGLALENPLGKRRMDFDCVEFKRVLFVNHYVISDPDLIASFNLLLNLYNSQRVLLPRCFFGMLIGAGSSA